MYNLLFNSLGNNGYPGPPGPAGEPGPKGIKSYNLDLNLTDSRININKFIIN